MAVQRFLNGCTYVYTQYGRAQRVKVVRFDPIANMHVVTANGRDEFNLDLHAFGDRIRAERTHNKPHKLDTSQVFLYLCSIGENTYKVGATCAPERRRKQIRTYTPLAKMKSVVRIPRDKGAQWSKLEKAVLRRFAAHRPTTGGREVLRLTTQQAGACARYMRAVAQTGA